MGYTHYWYRKVGPTDDQKFTDIVTDFRKMLPEFDALGIQLADGQGEDEPVIKAAGVIFNGRSKCGHAINEEISIPWPAQGAQGVAQGFDDNKASGTWFAGAEIEKRCCNGDCSYETFGFMPNVKQRDWEQKSEWAFDCCKTAFRPYDLTINCFLIIAKHHLTDEIKVKSDGDSWNWAEGRVLCHKVLGYGLNFELDAEEA